MLIPDTYKNYINAAGITKRERVVTKARRDFIREARANPSYCPNGYINEKKANFLLLSTQSDYKGSVIMFPDEHICRGDYVSKGDGNTWICHDVSEICEWQKKGHVWLCNVNLKWQDLNGKIHTKQCVFDSGVYSTALQSDTKITVLDKKFKVYIPYDEDTKTLYIDKRLAIDKRIDSFGNEVLEVFKITSLNRTGTNYGQNSHLLTLTVESDAFSAQTDNIERMICDYVEPPAPSSDICDYIIGGSTTLRCGCTRKYIVTDKDGQPVSQVNWLITPDNSCLQTQIDNGVLTIIDTKKQLLAGEEYILTATVGSTVCSKKIEVSN